jgi:hypothetical protein
LVASSPWDGPYLGELATVLRSEFGGEVVLVVGEPAAALAARTSVGQRIAAAAARFVVRTEKAMLQVAGRKIASLRERVRSIRTDAFDPAAAGMGLWRAPGDAGADGSRTDALDFVVLLSDRFGVPPPSVFGRATVIRLQLAEIRGRGTPLMGLREILMAEDRTSVQLEVWSAERSAWLRLLECGNRTRPLLSLNQAATWGRAASLLVAGIRRCLDSADRRPVLPVADHPPSGGAPLVLAGWRGLAGILVYPFSVAFNALRVALPGAGTTWAVAVLDGGSQPVTSLRGARMLRSPPGTWVADPWLHWDSATQVMYCFVEEFDERVGKGHIAAYRRQGDEWHRVGTALEQPFHLSFPHLFTYEGALYMCPDASASGAITVYRCVDLPLRWEVASVLMRDVSAADTMLFPRDGRWWMLTCIDRSPVPDHQSELHAFFADSPLATEWHPVASNPVHTDCHGARNGGLVAAESGLYRIGQCQSFAMYGHKSRVYRITKLSPSEYEEEPVFDLEPPRDLRAIGTHSYSYSNGVVAIDVLTRAAPSNS